MLRSWEISVKPEAINTTADGKILAGGQGKLFQFSADGKVQIEVDAPHAESRRKRTEALREEAIAYLERAKNSNSSSMKARFAMYESIIAQLGKKSETQELSQQETELLKALPAAL